jgi:hypothetical protein
MAMQGNNVERAADWIFSHMDELDALEDTSVCWMPWGEQPAVRHH